MKHPGLINTFSNHTSHEFEWSENNLIKIAIMLRKYFKTFHSLLF